MKVNKKWRDSNRDYLRTYWRSKRTTEMARLQNSIRCGVHRSFRKTSLKKSARTESILGCSFSDFKKHIESKFEPWMSWDNYGKFDGAMKHGWDLDHITPVSSAKTVEDVIKLNHYTNFQPLCSFVNRAIKSDKTDWSANY